MGGLGTRRLYHSPRARFSGAAMISPMSEADRRLPIIPLEDVVHFPRTSVRLHVQEPRYRRLVRDLLAQDEETRLVGLVLVKPGHEEAGEGLASFFPAVRPVSSWTASCSPTAAPTSWSKAAFASWCVTRSASSPTARR